MESIYTDLAPYGSKNVCARTDIVFLPISEVCDGTVSLMEPSKCAPRNFGAFKVRPAEFWSNKMYVSLSHGDTGIYLRFVKVFL